MTTSLGGTCGGIRSPKPLYDDALVGTRGRVHPKKSLDPSGPCPYPAAMTEPAPLHVSAFYHFAALPDPASAKPALLATCQAAGVTGTILLAPEGINGSIAGTKTSIDAVLAQLRSLPGFAGLTSKESPTPAMPFGKIKVRLKREIVTMGQPDVDPASGTGHYVAPADWNALISAPDVAVIDTRNAYEVAIGSFLGAIDPGTAAFGDFPDWWAKNAARFAGQRVAMFCTGGIRCEKATNFLMAQGVTEVFHLQGGILKYLEEVPEAESLWQGECFVFDDRVSVGHGLVPGDLTSCGACRHPLTDADRADPAYERGVACPHCAATRTEADRARYRERQRQMDLAAARGIPHLGQTGPD
jgi:UPF0176 protein